MKTLEKRIGFVASCFDMGPHAGHIEYIKYAKQNCDYLVAGLHIDPSKERPTKNKPILTIYERYIALEANKYIDEIVPYETEAELHEILLLKNVTHRFLGSDYFDKVFTGSNLDHIQNIFLERRHSISSSDLRKRVTR